MAFTNGQNVQANDLNNLSVTTVTTTGDITAGDDVIVTDDLTVGGDATITGSLTVGGANLVGLNKDTVCGRLTLTTAVPVTVSDVTAATTLYFALYGGNEIALYNGTNWQGFTISELSISVPATTNQMYDVFVNYNAGTPALALTAWTNDTTRATALTTQNGVLVKSGSTGQRYVGSFRTTGVSGQTEDSLAKRYVWNYYNRIQRVMRVLESTDSWTYTTATWRQANNAAANQLDFVVGVQEVQLFVQVHAWSLNDAGAERRNGIGFDATNAPVASQTGLITAIGGDTARRWGIDTYTTYPAVGRHFAAWLEYSVASGTTTFYGDQGDSAATQSGIYGWIQG